MSGRTKELEEKVRDLNEAVTALEHNILEQEGEISRLRSCLQDIIDQCEDFLMGGMP